MITRWKPVLAQWLGFPDWCTLAHDQSQFYLGTYLSISTARLVITCVKKAV